MVSLAVIATHSQQVRVWEVVFAVLERIVLHLFHRVLHAISPIVKHNIAFQDRLLQSIGTMYLDTKMSLALSLCVVL